MNDSTHIAVPDADLEELMALANREAAERRRLADAKRRATPTTKRTVSHLYDPDRWLLAANVELYCTYHLNSQSDEKVKEYIGHFLEWTHKTEVGARKLIRTSVSDASLPTREETLHSSFHSRPADTPAWRLKQFTFQAIIAANLEREFALACPDAILSITAVEGLGILEANTAERTRFTSPDGINILWVPRGFDLLDSLSRESKLEIRAAFEAECAQRTGS